MIQEIARRVIVGVLVKQTEKHAPKVVKASLKTTNQFLKYSVRAVGTGLLGICKVAGGIVETAIDVVTLQVQPKEEETKEDFSDRANPF